MRAPRVLICDDDDPVRRTLAAYLREDGYVVDEVRSGERFLEEVPGLRPVAALIATQLPGIDGVTTLRRLRASGADIPVLMLSEPGGVGTAVEATQLGATAYLQKPLDPSEVSGAVAATLRHHRSSTTIHAGARDGEAYEGLIGASPELLRVFEVLERLEVVETPTVLITGESGTGKDLIARAIHGRGTRAGGPFVEVDCTAIPENLMESTLFGHEKGAFTDAKTAHSGIVETARGGVLFLDEIGELPITLQAKLLRVLENRTYKRVGGHENRSFDAAIVAATNRDIKADAESGSFREDLYYRLAVIEIRVPPLRARPTDIPLLVHHFVEAHSASLGRPVEGITEEAMGLLTRYHWPGNVRELRNVVERTLILRRGPVVEAADLPASIRYSELFRGGGCPWELPDDGIRLEDVEAGLVVQALERAGGNQSVAATLVGLSRHAFRNRLKKYKLI